jgi:hypothetical protein
MEGTEGVRPRDQAVRAGPPPRPRTNGQLHFKRKQSVQWFSPSVLANAGLRVVLSSAFGEFLDKRELQASIAAAPLEHRSSADEIWLDFVADTGDGFAPTYTVAWLASQPELAVPGAGNPLPRADLLILGGDEVYPVGDPDAYENKFVGPYEAALPWTGSNSPDLYAIGGNHDWYDGLTSFTRIFCQQKWIGGRLTHQTRSYFAVQLPHRWWLWGIDIQLDSYIDDPQLRYFEAAVELMQEGDRVILCTATPSWVDVRADPRGFKNLAYLETRLIRPARARVMLSVSGDSHHYAHFVAADGTHKVTAGGGGAFLHPTHELPRELDLQVDPTKADSHQTYQRTACYPDQPASRRLALGAVALPLRNPSFIAVPAIVYLLLGWAAQFSLRAFGTATGGLDATAPRVGAFDLALGLARNPISILLVLVFFGALVAFAKPPDKWSENPGRILAKVGMGLAHLILQLVALILVGLLAVKLVGAFADRGWFTFWLLVAVGVLGGLVGGFTTGLYLAACNAIPGFYAHGNEAFSAMRLTSYRNFLRMHLDRDGVLHVYPLGVRRSVTRWRLDPDNKDDASWLAPEEGAEPVVHLIERPFEIGGLPR